MIYGVLVYGVLIVAFKDNFSVSFILIYKNSKIIHFINAQNCCRILNRIQNIINN